MKLAIVAVALVLGAEATLLAGDLEPPGAPAPTMKTLDQVEARIPLSAVGGRATALHWITQPGSYYLTGNVTGMAGMNGIEIATDDVTIDLNGYALVGVPGSLDGIVVDSAQQRYNLRIVDGTVRGWGGNGVVTLFASNVLLHDLRASHNGLDGLHVGGDSQVIRCAATQNGGDGITAMAGSVVLASTASSNGGDGFVAGTGTTIADCAASYNGDDGIASAGDGSAIRNCTSIGNTGDGIQVQSEAHVIGNTCDSNFTGIHVTSGANRIDGNHTTFNVSRGIDVDGGGNTIIRNVSSVNTTNYDIVAGNDVGPIGSAATATSPWANLQ
jgi:hypothetical protein